MSVVKPRTIRAIIRFEHAVIAYAFRGALHPDDQPRAEKEYTAAKRGLLLAIAAESLR